MSPGNGSALSKFWAEILARNSGRRNNEKIVLGSLLAAGLALSAQSGAQADTLSTVKERGKINCGVSQGVAGFSSPDDQGKWTGFDIDFAVRCRRRSLAIPTR